MAPRWRAFVGTAFSSPRCAMEDAVLGGWGGAEGVGVGVVRRSSFPLPFVPPLHFRILVSTRSRLGLGGQKNRTTRQTDRHTDGRMDGGTKRFSFMVVSSCKSTARVGWGEVIHCCRCKNDDTSWDSSSWRSRRRMRRRGRCRT